MNKRKLVTVVALIGVAGMLTTSPNTTRVKADHCHPTHVKSPEASVEAVNRSVKATESNPGRPRNSTRVLSINNKKVRAGVSSLENKPVGPEILSLDEIYSRDFPMAILSIGQAVKAIQSGDSKTELTELSKALDKLITVYKALGTQLKPQYANSLLCPIMGSPIDIIMVNESLTRSYKGRNIAFCCAGCPSAWDKLTDTQKQAKVPAVNF